MSACRTCGFPWARSGGHAPWCIGGTFVLNVVPEREPPRPRPPLQPCGTRASWQRGCRCEPCVEAMRAYARERQAIRRAEARAYWTARDALVPATLPRP